MKRLLVGIDGSPEAEAAARKAADLAKAFEANLLLVYVVPSRPPRSAETYAAEAKRADVVEQDYVPALLFQAELACRNAGVVAETTTRTGPVAETLAEMAESDGFDLVVVGHRGRGAVRRALLGSVADRLAQICPRPVLVVR
jgi:nucleotide-binding universal stress UspA family protein